MKRPFLVFICAVAALVAGSAWFIQSEGFARFFKNTASRYLPKDLGIEADFSEFAIKLYPPGISLNNPVITLRERNILKMPAGSSVRAERVDLIFRPLQMLSGDIRVNEVAVINGELNAILPGSAQKAQQPPKAKRPLSLAVHWNELLQIRAEAFTIQNTRIRLEWKDSGESLAFNARAMRVGQWKAKDGIGYQASFDIDQLQGSVVSGIPLTGALERIQATARVSAQGVQLDSLSLRADGLEASAVGVVKGDILNPKGLFLDGEGRIKSDLAKIREHLGAKSLREISGIATFSGKVRGNLEKPLDTLRAEGVLELENPSYQSWRADHLKAEGTWQASAEGGEITLSKAVIEQAELPRVGGHRPGAGGRVEVGAVKLRLPSPGAVTIPLTLDRAHIHWLGAPALKAVYPLTFRASGPVKLSINPVSRKGKAAQGWAVEAQLGLKISEFQLDNQRLGQTKPLRRVLRIPQFSVDGGLAVDSGSLRPNNLLLSVNQKTRVKLAGKIDFKSGYDLYGNGQVDLSEIGEISETAIRGEGALGVHVHGPASNVFIDFDADLQEAHYVNLDFGSLRGRITWEDDANKLHLRGLQLVRGRTAYAADGLLDLGPKDETMQIQVRVSEGDVSDLIRIFRNLTEDIWWFPSTLHGGVTGEVKVSGGISMDRMEILGRLSGRGWEYLGERFDAVHVTGGYDKGRYHVSDFRATKHGGKLSGRISAVTTSPDSTFFDWDFHTQLLSLSDLDRIAQLDVPIRGKLSVDSVGKGRTGSISSSSQVLLSDISVRGIPMPPSQLFMKSESGRTEVKASALGGQGTLELSYDFAESASSFLRAEAKSLDFSPVLLLLNPRTIPDPAIAGRISGAAQLSFKTGRIERGSGSIEIQEYVLSRSGSRFRLAHPVSFRVNDGSFDIRDLTLIGQGAGGNRTEATLALTGRNAQLDGTVSGELDVGIIEFLTSTVSNSSGSAVLDVALGGTLKEPTILGKATLDGASFRVASVDTPFENVTGSVQLKQNVLAFRNLEADLAGGRVGADGTVALFADRYPEVALKGFLSGNKLKVYPFQYAKIRGGLEVKGDQIPYLVSGAVIVESALSREKVLQQKSGSGLKAVQYTPPPSSRGSDYPRFKLNIDVKGENGILVQNDLFDVETRAQITLVNTLEAPRLLGNVEVIQGRMMFKDRTFQIQSGTAVFDNPTVLNPRFNLTANTDLSGIKVNLYAAGRMDKWKVELTSTPSMPEGDIISLLALGMTSSDAKRLSQSDRTLFEQGEAASLLLHSLDFNREVENRTGLQFQLEESVNAQQGTSIFRPSTQSDTSAAPKIVIKKQITKNVDISYGSTVGVGTGSQQEVNAEVQVSPGFSVIGVYDNYQTTDTKNKQESYGLDFKVQKRFK